MRNWIPGLVMAVVLLCSSPLSAAEGFVPKWNVGDHWLLEASYRDMRLPGEVWMPPIQWVFKVRAIKAIADQNCYVIHVFPRNVSMKVQAVLWLAVDDLRPIRVIDIYPTNEGVKSSERDLDPMNPQPLLAEDTLVPYDLPVFPLVRSDAAIQNADGFNAYRSEPVAQSFSRVTKVGNLSFKRTVAQKNKAPEKQFADTFNAYRSNSRNFQVELAEPRSNTSLMQLWQEGSPWALRSESVARKIRLLLPKNAGQNNQNGGND